MVSSERSAPKMCVGTDRKGPGSLCSGAACRASLRESHQTRTRRTLHPRDRSPRKHTLPRLAMAEGGRKSRAACWPRIALRTTRSRTHTRRAWSTISLVHTRSAHADPREKRLAPHAAPTAAGVLRLRPARIPRACTHLFSTLWTREFSRLLVNQVQAQAKVRVLSS